MKHKKIFFIIIAIFLFLLIAGYKFMIGSITYREGKENACNFKDFSGTGNIKIFPEISKDNDNVEIVKYNYLSIDTFMDPTCKVYLECKYKNISSFERECSRLEQIKVEMDEKTNKIVYKEDVFSLPAYIAMYNYSSCFEYALVDEVNKTIIYIYMQGTDYKIPKEYLPKDKTFNDKISIYHFNGKKVDKSF